MDLHFHFQVCIALGLLHTRFSAVARLARKATSSSRFPHVSPSFTSVLDEKGIHIFRTAVPRRGVNRVVIPERVDR